MGRLEGAKPRDAFVLGLALLGVFPTDIMTTVTVGLHLAHHGHPLWHALPFIVLTLLLLALPAIAVMLFGKRAERALPKVRDWMSDNSWIVHPFAGVLREAVRERRRRSRLRSTGSVAPVVRP